MTDPVDPRRMLGNQRPSRVEYADGDVEFFAHADPRDGGWLFARRWNGQTCIITREEVAFVERADTEVVDRTESGTAIRRLSDSDHLVTALEKAGIDDAQVVE